MFQNRVDPFGELIRTKARGTLMGNRGVIHNQQQEIIRPFRLKAWITCVLTFKDRHRKVMQPNRWTELFFLDEATAFAAGHRPCAECRRQDFNSFKQAWIAGNPDYGFTLKTPIAEIDQVIHSERIDSVNSKKTFPSAVRELPEGTFLLCDQKTCLLKNARLYPWTPEGYLAPLPLPTREIADVLTPKSIVRAFQAGYSPAHVIY